MFVRRVFSVLLAISVIACPMMVSYGEESARFSQACAWEQNVDIFIEGELDSQNISCKISNQEAEIMESGLLTNVGATIRTTLLVDISTSIPSASRESVKAFIRSLIENIGVGEQYRIVTFGENFNVLQEFSSDRYALANAADQIVFDGQYSIVYDSIFNTIPEIEPIDGRPCYYRTIVITDGVDDTASGVTKEELYLRLQEGTYPIDVAEVSKSQNGEANKELSALTRISGGQYGNLYPEADVSGLINTYKKDHIFWIRAKIPGTLLDGSVRQVDVFDGTNTLQFDMKVPVFDAPESETSTEESQIPETTQETVKETVAETESVPETADAFSDRVNARSAMFKIVIFVCLGIVAVGVIVGIVALLIVKSKKKKTSTSKDLPGGGVLKIHDKTEIIREEPNGGSLYIRVKNRTEGHQIWDMAIGQGILIGRSSHCQICIAEGTVAREQCQLYQTPGGVMVKNLSTSNITCLNGQKIQAPVPLNSGDQLKCGRILLLVESIYSSGTYGTEDLNKMTTFVNV